MAMNSLESMKSFVNFEISSYFLIHFSAWWLTKEISCMELTLWVCLNYSSFFLLSDFECAKYICRIWIFVIHSNTGRKIISQIIFNNNSNFDGFLFHCSKCKALRCRMQTFHFNLLWMFWEWWKRCTHTLLCPFEVIFLVYCLSVDAF